MHQPRGDTQLLSGFASDPCKQSGHIMFIEPIQGTSQAIVIELFRFDPLAKQMLQRLMFKVLRDQVQAPEAFAESIEDHGHGRCPNADLPMGLRLLIIQILRQS